MKQSKNRPGIGLYTYEQAKGTTPFQYLVGVVVGMVFVVSGALLAYGKYPIPAAALIVLGVFIAHAGVIFWVRRFRSRA